MPLLPSSTGGIASPGSASAGRVVGLQEPNLNVLLRYSEIAGQHMEVLANDNLKLPK